MRGLLALLLCSACAASAPELVPLGPLLAQGDALAAAPPSGAGLAAEAEALSARAGALPSPAGGEAARLAGLQARAEALRGPVLSEEERGRLVAGPSLP